jgi:hypothetical protein
MSSRTGNWMTAFGVLVGFVGLCMIPAGLGNHGDRSLLGLGTALFGTGGLLAAVGIYLKALVLSSKPTITAPASANAKTKPRGGCDLCKKEMPVVHCKVHQFHLCGACLAQHYDFRACVYVPSTRRTEVKTGRSMSARAHG